MDSDHNETGTDVEAEVNISGESSHHLVNPVCLSVNHVHKAAATYIPPR